MNDTRILLADDDDEFLEILQPFLFQRGYECRATNSGTDCLDLLHDFQPDILMLSETKEVVLEPDGSAEIAVRVKRQNGFGGRVPVQVLNLPPRVRVLDVGLNGVLITEDEQERTFRIEALASAQPVDQLIYVGGLVETRSTLQNSYAAIQPVLVKVKPGAHAAARPPADTERSSAPK